MKPTTLMVCTTSIISPIVGSRPAAAQSPWNAVATRGDAERDDQVARGTRLLAEGDCQAAFQQAREAASGYDTRTMLDREPLRYQMRENAVGWTGKWVARTGRPIGSRREYGRLNDELEQVEARLACLHSGW